MKSLRLSIKREINSVGVVTEESVLDKETASFTLSQGEVVDFNITADLKDGHSLVVWQHQGYRTRQGD